MKILITGGNGYVGKSIHHSLESRYQITTITRLDFDLTDGKAMRKWFDGKQFDAVIHTAIAGGSRLKSDSETVLEYNLLMHYNLLSCRDHFSRLIGFGSGAEIFAPETPYGLSKRVIANSIKETPNWYNIRIFGVFDENELPTRFIKANINRYLRKEPMKIHQNKMMDFFYMKDLISLVRKYLTDSELPKQVDCSYAQKHTLVDIAGMINRLSDHSVNVEVQTEGMGSYYGQPLQLDIPLIGLEQGIAETFKSMSSQ